MKETVGACIFCGQTSILKVPESYNQEDVNNEVTKRCDCIDAKVYTKREERIAGAERAIKDLFKDLPTLEDIKEYLISAARPVAENKFSKITISKGKYTASMKPGKEALKISLKYTDEQTQEI